MNLRKMLCGVILGLGACSLAATVALAGDNSQIEPIGFSKDGKYFAFEQYGEQDGTGAAYSEIYFLNVAKNTWSKKPVRIRVTEENVETQDLQYCRDRARMGAARTLDNQKILSGTVEKVRLADYPGNWEQISSRRKEFKFEAYTGDLNTLTVSGKNIPGVVGYNGENAQC